MSLLFQEALASREILAVLNGCQSSYIMTSVDEAEDTLRLDPSPAFGFSVLVNNGFSVIGRSRLSLWVDFTGGVRRCHVIREILCSLCWSR